MNTKICLMALLLAGCSGADFEEEKPSAAKLSPGDAGETSTEPGSGGSGGTKGGKAGAPNAQGGSEIGSAGTPDDLPSAGSSSGSGSGGSGTAGKGSAGSDNAEGGTAGLPVAGSGNAGSPNAGAPTAGMGTGGSGSAGMPAAGSGGTDSVAGSGGNGIDNSNNCNADGRLGNWTDPTWLWNTDTQTTQCTSQMKRVGKSVLNLVAPALCSWQYDVTASESWQGCRFTNTLTCQANGPTMPAFTMQVSSSFVDSDGNLGGTVYFKADTAAGCSNMNTLPFSATRY